MLKIIGIIPARYASTRFEGKVLTDIAGKSMVQRVYEQASKAQRLSKVLVATDDERVWKHIQSCGGNVVLTSDKHPSGTDRCAEAISKVEENFDVLINIQGDEPFIDPAQIDEIAALFDDPGVQIATLAKKINSYEELVDEKEAKVVLDSQQNAIYMSRSPVPFLRGTSMKEWHQSQPYYKHIGIYGFRTEVIARIAALPPTDLEKSESLEQLRWLEHFRIRVGITEFETLAIDTKEDLKFIRQYLKD